MSKIVIQTIIIILTIFNYTFAQQEVIGEKIDSLKENIQDIVIGDNYLFALSNDSFIKIYDISTPYSPKFLSDYDIKRKAKKLSFYKHFLYIGDGESGAIFLDVSDINDIYIKLSYFNKEHQPFGVVVKDNISYQADGTNGINIVDISDPYNSYIISNLKGFKNARDVDIKDNFLYVADGEGGIKIVDVSDKRYPYIIKQITIKGFINDIKIKDNVAFVANEKGDLLTFDISNPNEIFQIPNNLNEKDTRAIDIENNYAYIVKSNGILDIFEIKENLTPANNISDIESFVKLLYEKILDREADKGGLNYWIIKVQEGASAVEIAEKFLESEEFKNKNLNDEEFITILYEVFLDREPDPAGLKYWTKRITETSRKQLFYEFAFSKEFANNMTTKYKIIPYSKKDKLKAFIERFYGFVLNRESDPKGVSYWVNALLDGSKTPESVALSFFNSKEFKNRNLNDEDFVKTLYRTLLNREADEKGLKYWTTKLQEGTPRIALVKSFIKQPEFKKIEEFFVLLIFSGYI